MNHDGNDQTSQLILVQALGRGFLQRKCYNILKAMQSKRNKIVQEVLTSERTYVTNLRILSTVFLEPLMQTELVKEDKLKALFKAITVIMGYSKALLTDLAERVTKWTVNTKLGDIFLKMVVFFKTYTHYINNYKEALETIERLSSSKAFLDWNNSLDKEVCGGLTFSAYLIMPIQRIPRYRLLLDDLVKNTWDFHIDYNDLRKALTLTTEITGFVNAAERDAEDLRKVFTINSSLTDMQEELIKPWRRLVKEGPISSSDGKSFYLFLFNDALLWSRPRTNAKKFQFLRLCDISTLAFGPLDGEDADPLAFFIEEEEQGSLKCVVGKESEVTEWITALSQAKDLSQDIKKNSRRSVTNVDQQGKPRFFLRVSSSPNLKHTGIDQSEKQEQAQMTASFKSQATRSNTNASCASAGEVEDLKKRTARRLSIRLPLRKGSTPERPDFVKGASAESGSSPISISGPSTTSLIPPPPLAIPPLSPSTQNGTIQTERHSGAGRHRFTFADLRRDLGNAFDRKFRTGNSSGSKSNLGSRTDLSDGLASPRGK
eukprot:TRINITY_DN5713_c0_g1_i1.p1 TRINITY_DN5713_c0_g1~~TRINITY_DN5713_c0_g1_i1.p1  ORF type:complete len:545 (+),score=83.61 TRINITY_DN5713_c0_g1_i1:36-1670(+)